MAMAQNGKSCFFIQFAGQGVKYMDELRRLYTTCPDVRPFVLEAIAAIKEQASRYDDTQTGFFSSGLDVDRWLDHPEETPDFGYLMSSPISHPLIYLCQISNYISMVLQGLDQEKLLLHTRSITGFSTGIVAAILCSMGLPLDDLWKQAIKVQSMFLWQGVRTQQSILQYNVRPKLEAELDATPEGCLSCMASIADLERDRLEETIDAFSGSGDVYLAYELLQDRCIVSGLPEDLSEFKTFLKTREKDATWRYIPSTIAAHSPYLAYALESTPMDAGRIGLKLNGDDMKIPVLSNSKGVDLRKSNNVIMDVMRAYFVNTAEWRSQIAPLAESNHITHVLDFGPGTGVASLTETHIAGSNIPVIRCSLPLGRKMLFDDIMKNL